ncbi:MAG: NrfD/PsrC family molybdoenzyme membrane anchor subunit [Micromonosporaceae bacterium]
MGRRGEQPMVPAAEFTSYYGRPVLKEPVWEAPDIPGYLFLGGLAGASSVLAVAAQIRGCPDLARSSKAGAAGAIGLSAAALMHDLGRPSRFTNMLRVFKPTSPMNVGSWLLAAYGPAAGAAALSAVTGRLRRAGLAASAGAAVLGPAVCTYTAALICDTAVPAWHEGHREMPYLFAGSAASAAGGLGLLTAPCEQAGPARRLAVLGAAAEITSAQLLTRRIGIAAEPYESGTSGAMFRASEVATACALGVAFLGRRRRLATAIAGATLLAASATTRFAIFRAGRVSARDPKYTIVPQRERLAERQAAREVSQATGSGQDD